MEDETDIRVYSFNLVPTFPMNYERWPPRPYTYEEFKADPTLPRAQEMIKYFNWKAEYDESHGTWPNNLDGPFIPEWLTQQ